MKKKSVENIAFSKYTPSAFLVVTPFQLLCALEAIREFQIKEFELILTFNRNEKRNEQVFAMLQDLGLPCNNVIYLDEIKYIEFKSSNGLFAEDNKKKYQRVFVGDVFSVKLKMLATRYVSEGASLVYLDDGNSMIQSLKGISFELFPKRLIDIYGMKWSFWKERTMMLYKYKKYCKKHDIFKRLNVFTIYYGIKTKHINIYPNRFCHLQENEPQQLEDMVLFIGNPIGVFSSQMAMSESEVEELLSEKLYDIRKNNPDTKIVYIPHGRDVNQNISRICSMQRIEYTPISEAIEMYVIKNNIRPRIVYAINSTALLTLKMIIRDIHAVNIRIDKRRAPFRKFFEEVSEYYETEGIVEDLVKI